MHIPRKKHKGYDPLGDCGKGKCPICARNNALLRSKDLITKEDFASDAVAPFVGRFGYPNINVGILAPPQHDKEANIMDAPQYWAANNYQLPKIVDFRSSLLNSRYNIHIKKQASLLELSQDIAMAAKPVDVEVHLKQKPHFRLNLDASMAPTGPNAPLQSAELTENPSIHTKVYKVFDDTDLKAADAVTYLYNKDFDENFLQRILSVGTLGLKTNRKLVPTRWSIIATDDILGKSIITDIKDYQQLGSHQAFYADYLGNHYLILLLPEIWSYELFETYVPPNWATHKELRHTTDHETHNGRKYYAENTAGGYYTVRLAILEHLKRIKRQATAIALRYITYDYQVPVGVWVTRECTRKAMNNKPIEFSSRELLLDYARKFVKKKFGYNLDFNLRKSVLLRRINTQKKLFQF